MLLSSQSYEKRLAMFIPHLLAKSIKSAPLTQENQRRILGESNSKVSADAIGESVTIADINIWKTWNPVPHSIRNA